MRRALWEAMRRQRQAGEPAAPPPEGKTYRRKPGPRPRPESRKPSLPARKKTAPAPAAPASAAHFVQRVVNPMGKGRRHIRIQRIQLEIVFSIVHAPCPPCSSFCLSNVRARESRLLTVPSGSPSTWAISRTA